MKRNLLLLLLVIIVVSCQPQHNDTGVVLSGTIVNPNRDYVTLRTSKDKIDTAFLSQKGNFIFSVNLDSAGLVKFSHYPEQQNIYLVPGDSLQLRLNTLAFDETLKFSGDSGEENNVLMRLFLMDEINDDVIVSLYRKSPQDFIQIADSISQKQHQILAQRAEKKAFSSDFTTLARDLIAYQTHYLKERYFHLLLKYNRAQLALLPNDFFSYRDSINFNHPDLSKHISVTRFLETYIQNKAIEDCDKSYTQCFDPYNFDMLKRRIEIAKSLPLSQEKTDYFLRKFALKAIIYADNKRDIESVLRLLDSTSEHKTNFEKILSIAQIQRGYLPGENVGSTPIITIQNEKISLESTLKQPTFIYTWSSRYPEHHINQHKIIADLRAQFGEVSFIGLNIDNDVDVWRKVVERYGYDPQQEYQLGEINLERKLLYHYLDKTLLVNQDKRVIRGDLMLTDPLIVNKLSQETN